ncbi:MAG: single-stranded DNA-binding protein [Nocardioidaceae bacterium]|nr:single-stranded DNA-binding protein [Nocardioidaceae bacterium]
MVMVEQGADAAPANVVALVGRLTAIPEERTLPSGDVIVAFRISVPRSSTPMSKRSKQTMDWVDCVSAGARCRRSARSWVVGDVIEVDGVLRRRFLRGDGAGSTRLEVEALRVRRAAS